MRIIVIRFPCAVTDFREGEINAKREIGRGKVGFELVNDFAKLGRRVAQTTDATESAGVGDGGCERTTACACHSGEEDWVFDVEEGGERSGYGALSCHGCGVFLGSLRGWCLREDLVYIMDEL